MGPKETPRQKYRESVKKQKNCSERNFENGPTLMCHPFFFIFKVDFHFFYAHVENRTVSLKNISKFAVSVKNSKFAKFSRASTVFIEKRTTDSGSGPGSEIRASKCVNPENFIQIEALL
jgi:hypothetical protein